MINTSCTSCGSANAIPPHYLNRSVKCPSCGNSYTATEHGTYIPPEPAAQPERPVNSSKSNKSDMRPYCPRCDEQVTPQIVRSEGVTSLHCSYCGTDAIPVEFCESCNDIVLMKTEFHRFSGWSWNEAEMGFCSQCDKQLAGPTKSACFIATSAFNDANAPEVQSLRLFRDRTLSRYRFGRLLVDAYYEASPKLAVFLDNNSYLKRPVRRLLKLFVCGLNSCRTTNSANKECADNPLAHSELNP